MALSEILLEKYEDDMTSADVLQEAIKTIEVYGQICALEAEIIIMKGDEQYHYPLKDAEEQLNQIAKQWEL